MKNNLARLEKALSSVRHVREYQVPAGSLVGLLAREFPQVNPNDWPTLLRGGGIYVNGVRTVIDTALPSPCRIEYFELKPESTARHVITRNQIVYEDEFLLALWKPPGIPCTPTREQQHFNLKALAEEFWGIALHLPSRLDTSAQGIVLISKSSRTHRALQHAFEYRAIRKEYLLEVSGRVQPDSFVVLGNIGRDPHHAILRRMVSQGGRDSESKFQVVERRSNSTLLRAYPRTGRTHQLRVHCAHVGYPIHGDNFYGGSESTTLHLLAYRFTFTHPISQAPLDITVPDHLLPAWSAR